MFYVLIFIQNLVQFQNLNLVQLEKYKTYLENEERNQSVLRTYIIQNILTREAGFTCYRDYRKIIRNDMQGSIYTVERFQNYSGYVVDSMADIYPRKRKLESLQLLYHCCCYYNFHCCSLVGTQCDQDNPHCIHKRCNVVDAASFAL